MQAQCSALRAVAPGTMRPAAARASFAPQPAKTFLRPRVISKHNVVCEAGIGSLLFPTFPANNAFAGTNWMTAILSPGVFIPTFGVAGAALWAVFKGATVLCADGMLAVQTALAVSAGVAIFALAGVAFLMDAAARLKKQVGGLTRTLSTSSAGSARELFLLKESVEGGASVAEELLTAKEKVEELTRQLDAARLDTVAKSKADGEVLDLKAQVAEGEAAKAELSNLKERIAGFDELEAEAKEAIAAAETAQRMLVASRMDTMAKSSIESTVRELQEELAKTKAELADTKAALKMIEPDAKMIAAELAELKAKAETAQRMMFASRMDTMIKSNLENEVADEGQVPR